LIRKYLDQAMETNDEEFLQLYIKQNLTILFECGMYKVALNGLKPVANYDNPLVQEAIVTLLVRARQKDPEYVEDILLRGEYPQVIVDRVMASPTSEQMVDLISYQLVNILYDLFLLGPESLRGELQWLLSQAYELNNVNDWLALIIKEIFNILVGEIVFKVPEDAPSRQIAQTGMSAS
jgi:hypothetical protein